MNYTDNKQPVVLFVDDNKIESLLASGQLHKAGFNSIVRTDGQQCIAAFKELLPEIVLLDVEMPNMDGYETCIEIRKLPNGKNIPIIMMTATESPQRIAQSYASGATDFVLKPINWEILAHRLNYMLKASHNFRKLALSELRLAKTIKMTKVGGWEWQIRSEGLYWSDEMYAIAEVDKHTFIPSIWNYCDFVHRDDLPHVKEIIKRIIKTKKANSIEFRIITASKKERIVSQQIEPINDYQGSIYGLIGTVQDITERKDQENKIRRLAYYDDVTKLPNRVFFLEYLAKTIKLSKRNQRNFAILFSDLDGFKGINDTYGHQAGDLLLKEISMRLTNGLRCSDLASRNFNHNDYGVDAARLGGDEFIILLNELARPEDAAIVAERIKHWVNKPVTLGDRQVRIGVSIGIAVFPHDGEDAETLMKNADMAMYHAKNLGKGHYQFFHEGMAIRAKKRLEMETYMHLAITKNELRLHYQPVVNAITGQLIGAEALLRWESPQLGFLPPNDFISLAEENGMIIQFGEWVIREVCRQQKIWQLHGLGDLNVSVNLSSLQINQSSFVAMISGIIHEHKVNPEFLTFELTESMIMSDADNVLNTLKQLKELGIKLSIDDFGTGYSSLRYLNRFPLDILKIDRSFVRELPNSPAIVNAVLSLSKSLNLKTIAEGVETDQQKAFLQNANCDAIQGYYYSKPLPVEQFEAYWIQNNSMLNLHH